MMNQMKCLFGMHHYAVLETNELKDYRGTIVGKVIVLQCKDCGRIKACQIRTTTQNY